MCNLLMCPWMNSLIAGVLIKLIDDHFKCWYDGPLVMETVSSCASRSINRHSIGCGYWGGARRCWDVTQSFSMCDNWPQMLPSDTEEEPPVRHVTAVASSWKWDFLKWKVLCYVLLNRAGPRERLGQLEENHLAALTSSNIGWVNCSSLILYDGAVDKWDRTLLDTNLEKENVLENNREFWIWQQNLKGTIMRP